MWLLFVSTTLSKKKLPPLCLVRYTWHAPRNTSKSPCKASFLLFYFNLKWNVSTGFSTSNATRNSFKGLELLLAERERCRHTQNTLIAPILFGANCQKTAIRERNRLFVCGMEEAVTETDICLLGCNAAKFVESHPTRRRNTSSFPKCARYLLHADSLFG
jgi:hypothetical protein